MQTPLPLSRLHIPAWRAASAGLEPARHAVCTPPSSPRSGTRLAARAPNLLLLQSRPPASLGDALLGASLHLRNWHPECRPAPPWPLRAHDAALLACLPPARRRASTPCMHMQTWRSPAVGLGPLSFRVLVEY